MQQAYLEVTFRNGRPFAAYYYLPRRTGDRSHKTRQVEAGMLVDFTRDGRAIGVEITAPSKTSLAALNRVLRDLGQSVLTRTDVAPLRAA